MAEEKATQGLGVEELEQQRKTLFVRNLPFSTSDKELEDVFSEYGPIKRSFVVKDKDASRSCRGFGYVTFVLPEDATKALNAGINLNGRKIAVSVADKKPRQRDNYKKKNSQSPGDGTEASAELNENKKKLEEEKQPHKIDDKAEEIKRTIVISGLPNTATKSKIKLLCSKFGKVKKIEFPAHDRDVSTSIVIYKSIKSAVRGFQKINGSKFEDKVINSCLLSKEGKQPLKKVLDKSKLIVRNIAFKCKEDDLKIAFEKFGKIASIEIPTKVDGKGRKRMRGFAFVQFLNQQNAKSAMTELNKTSILGRPIVIDWAVPKDEFVAKSVDAEQGKNATEMKSKENSTKDAKKESTKNVNNVDKAKEDGECSESDQGDGDDESDAEEKDAGIDLYEATSDIDDDDDLDKDEDCSDEDSDGIISDTELERKIPKAIKKQSHDVKEGKTVFIRNLPFEASEEELNELFSKYGPIDYCKIVIDQETGHSRGSAFIKFKDSAIVENVISDSEDMDGGNIGIFMEGRRLVVMKAVTRGKVNEIEKQNKEAKKDPKDKRNLSLAQEGVIFPNSEAAKEISEADMKKREKAWAEKKAKLKNQNYFVSRTRLCVRNLPLVTGEKELRSAFMKAVNKKDIKIKRIRIMRNKERVDKSGKGRSLGYGFIEFESHEHALTTLRATNNNPDVFGDAKRPIVEFSVENKVALEVQEKRRERQMLKTENIRTQKAKMNDVSKVEETEKRGMRKGKGFSGRRGRNEAVGKKRGRDMEVKRRSESTEKVAAIEDKKENARNSRKRFKKEMSKEEKSNQQKIGANDRNQKFSQKKKNGPTESRKRKRDFEGETQSKTPKIKKLKKKGRTDKEEDKFNLLVNKYKERLFGEKGNKTQSAKRWFE